MYNLVTFLLLTTGQPKYYMGSSWKYQVVSEMVNFGGQDYNKPNNVWYHLWNKVVSFDKIHCYLSLVVKLLPPRSKRITLFICFQSNFIMFRLIAVKTTLATCFCSQIIPGCLWPWRSVLWSSLSTKCLKQEEKVRLCTEYSYYWEVT